MFTVLLIWYKLTYYLSTYSAFSSLEKLLEERRFLGKLIIVVKNLIDSKQPQCCDRYDAYYCVSRNWLFRKVRCVFILRLRCVFLEERLGSFDSFAF